LAGPLFENTNIPPRVAQAFAMAMRGERFSLDGSIESLTGDFETILCNPMYTEALVSLENRGQEIVFDFETAAACYLGQTLARKYNGKWGGHCSRDARLNFYTLWLMFGEYRFYPLIYVVYRTGHGVESTGGVSDLLASLEPSISDGVDYKQREHDLWMAEGRPIFDDKPWL